MLFTKGLVKMKANKKALSLIEIIVAVTMTVPLLVVANNYFEDTLEVNTYKNRIVKEKQKSKCMIKIKNTLHL